MYLNLNTGIVYKDPSKRPPKPVRSPLPVPPSPLVLMKIYRKIHDPDALHGVAQSASLTLQALKYTHTGISHLFMYTFISFYFVYLFICSDVFIFFDSTE